jgi:hypothetical protein
MISSLDIERKRKLVKRVSMNEKKDRKSIKRRKKIKRWEVFRKGNWGRKE